VVNNTFLCSMQGWLRVGWRFLYLLYATTKCIVRFGWLVWTGTDKKTAGLRVRRHWINRITQLMGLQLKVEGQPHQGPGLIVCNHISYIDPIAVLRYMEAQVVAKAEVKDWPLIGYGAHMVGTIFVKREEKTSRLEIAGTIRSALEDKETILIFPEGTTTRGPGTLPFKPRTFQAAYETKAPVQPVAIVYDSPIVAYIGDDTFLPHFFRVFKMKTITGRIAFGPLLSGPDMAEQAYTWINQVQAQYHPDESKHDRS
jgi:1-acyl-sn-glycerol-3-phosphate acyltransferase